MSYREVGPWPKSPEPELPSRHRLQDLNPLGWVQRASRKLEDASAIKFHACPDNTRKRLAIGIVFLS